MLERVGDMTILLQIFHNINKKSIYQLCFTEEFASSDQVANCHVEVTVATAPVGYLCERMGGQHILEKGENR